MIMMMMAVLMVMSEGTSQKENQLDRTQGWQEIQEDKRFSRQFGFPRVYTPINVHLKEECRHEKYQWHTWTDVNYNSIELKRGVKMTWGRFYIIESSILQSSTIHSSHLIFSASTGTSRIQLIMVIIVRIVRVDIISFNRIHDIQMDDLFFLRIIHIFRSWFYFWSSAFHKGYWTGNNRSCSYDSS